MIPEELCGADVDGGAYDRYADDVRALFADPAVNVFEHEVNWLRLRALLPRSRSIRRVLDFGCGPGNFTTQLAEIYPRAQVVGVDTSEAVLPLERCQHDGQVQFAQWDGFVPNGYAKRDALYERLGVEENGRGFDLVVAKMSLHYMLGNVSNVDGWWHILEPKASVAFSLPHPDVSGRKVLPDGRRADFFGGTVYVSEIGNTGLQSSMMHRSARDWIGILASTNAIAGHGYHVVVDEPSDDSGAKKRLNVLFTPRRSNLTAMMQRLRACEGSEARPVVETILGKLGLHQFTILRGVPTTDSLSGKLILGGRLLNHQQEAEYWIR